MLGFQIGLQIAFLQPHGNAAHAIVLVRLVACPCAVDGNVAGQDAPVDHPHGQVTSIVAVTAAVEDALGGVPLRPRHDGLVVPRLVILVLFATVFARPVIVKIGRPRLARQYVAAVALVAHHAAHRGSGPARVGPAAHLSQPGLPAQLRQGGGDLRGAAPAQQHIVHQPHGPRLVFVDGQHLLPPAVPVRDFDAVIAQQRRREEAPPAEAPFQGEQHGFALHVALLFRDHGQHEEDDVAGVVQRVEVLLLEEYRDRRFVFLEAAHPADAVQQVAGEAAHALGDDHVDLAGHGVLHHQVEGRPVFRVGAGKAVVHIGAGVFPLGIRTDHVAVVVLLQLNGDDLVDVIRGDAAVSRDPQYATVVLLPAGGGDLLHALSPLGADFLTQCLSGAGALALKALPGRASFALALGRMQRFHPAPCFFFCPGPYVSQVWLTPVPLYLPLRNFRAAVLLYSHT